MHEFESAVIAGPAHACAQAAAGTAAAALHDLLDSEVASMDRSLALACLSSRALLTVARGPHLQLNDARAALGLAAHAGKSSDRITSLLERWWSANPGQPGATTWRTDAPEMAPVLFRLACGLRGRLRAAEVILRGRLAEQETLMQSEADATVARSVEALRKI